MLRHFDLGEELSIQFKCCGEMIERLLKIFVLQIGLSKLAISSYKNEEVLLVDVDEELTEGKLLYSYLDHFISILAD